METLSNVDEEILFASITKIDEMATNFRNLVTRQPRDYFVLRPCATYPSVTNGGPPFQIGGEVFDKWLMVTRTKCPLVLRHVMNFFRPWVGLDRTGDQPESKEVLQPRLRAHAAAYLTASQTTARMTISTAMIKLCKYAKVIASEKVGEFGPVH